MATARTENIGWGMGISDTEALKRFARSGDPEAFELLTRRYSAMVLATCRRRLAAEAAAEDAAQETFLKLARQASRVRTNVAAWLHATAVGTAIDVARRATARSRAERASSSQAQASSLPEDVLCWREIEPMIDQALSELADADRDLIVARFLAGRSQAELAQERSVSEGTISRRLRRALDSLRTKLVAGGVTLGGVGALAAALSAVSAEGGSAAFQAGVGKVALVGFGNGGSGAAAKSLSSLAVASVIVVCGGVVAFASLRGGGTNASMAAMLSSSSTQAEPGPERPTGTIGPFSIVSTFDESFDERGVFISETGMSIGHGTTDEGAIKRAVLQLVRAESADERSDGRDVLVMRVRQILPVGDPYSRFESGQLVSIAVEFDELGRLVLDPITEGLQLGRNEPRWFGVRPPKGWDEHGRIPDNAGPLGILGPWAEAERVPMTITSREIRFGVEKWPLSTYRIIEWEQREGYSRVLAVHANGRNPRLIGTRFRLIIRRDADGYTVAYLPPSKGGSQTWPSSFEYSGASPVRVVRVRDGS